MFGAIIQYMTCAVLISFILDFWTEDVLRLFNISQDLYRVIKAAILQFYSPGIQKEKLDYNCINFKLNGSALLMNTPFVLKFSFSLYFCTLRLFHYLFLNLKAVDPNSLNPSSYSFSVKPACFCSTIVTNKFKFSYCIQLSACNHVVFS